jgi:hypothetical protein
MSNLLNVYPLNLPLLEDIISDINALNNYKDYIIHYVSTSSIFKKEYTEILQCKFNNTTIFYKKPWFRSRIHIDNGEWDQNGNNKFVWGINWNYGGNGLYKFWKEEDIDNYSVEVNPRGRKHVLLNSSKPPYETYIHHYGAVLFNATLPHQVANDSDIDRFSFSIRTNLKEDSWEKVVQIFSPLIDSNLQHLRRIF